MTIKTAPMKIKAAGTEDGLQDGQFRAIVSVFGNKDSYGDVVVKGAFADTLAEWKASGDPIPVYYSHRLDDPDFNIGSVLEAEETDEGLEVLAELDLSMPKAATVHALLKGRRLTQFSFSYSVQDAGWAKSEELGEYYELRKLKLYEVGPTPVGANQETELLAVKDAARAATHLAAGLKAGRVLSAKNEDALRTAYKAIGDVLSALDDSSGAGNDDQGKASAGGRGKDEDPSGGKSEDLAPGASVDTWAAELSILSLAGAAGGEEGVRS